MAGPLCPRRAGFSGVALRSPPGPLSIEGAELGPGGDRLTPHRVGRSAQCAQRCRCPPPTPGTIAPHTKKPHPGALGARSLYPSPPRTLLRPCSCPRALHALLFLPLPLPKTKELRSYPTPPAALPPRTAPQD